MDTKARLNWDLQFL